MFGTVEAEDFTVIYLCTWLRNEIFDTIRIAIIIYIRGLMKFFQKKFYAIESKEVLFKTK